MSSRAAVEAWVSFERFSLRKFRWPLRPGPGGSPEPSFGRKLFMLAHASIIVPSTEIGIRLEHTIEERLRERGAQQHLRRDRGPPHLRT